jgi:carboxypeptidase PM20D1
MCASVHLLPDWSLHMPPHSKPRTLPHGRLLWGFLKLLLLALLGLAVVMAWRTWRLTVQQLPVAAQAGVSVQAEAAAQRLSQAVQLQTVSTTEDTHAAAFEALHQHLRASFPALHARLSHQAFGRHALLYTWPGSDPKAQPIALMAHQDVVPVALGTDASWAHPPFSGALADGYVWGRGAWDDKGSLMAILEAVELLVKSGFQPRQTVYLAFGADEELGGEDGARLIAQHLRQQGIKLRFVLDVGLLITHGMVPGVQRPVALVGVAEKGYVTFKLTAKGQGGHASMPPPRSPVGVLGEAVARVETHPMPARLSGLPQQMLEAVAPSMSLVPRVLMSNLWLTGPLVASQLEKSNSANAMLRSTLVATVFKAGERENVLPGVATAWVNSRLLPGDTSEAVEAHVREVLKGLDVSVQSEPQRVEASAISPSSGGGFELIARSLRELQPEVVVAPGLLVGGTDTRHFAEVADQIYRFSPVHAAPDDLARFHGTNERMAVSDLVQMVQFYERLLRRSNELPAAR